MKRVFLSFILTLILFTSCNTSDDVSSVTLTSTSDRIEEQIESQELKNVYEKVNIISSSYITQACKTRGIGSWFKGHISEAFADRVGGIIGGWAGKHIGAGVGAATGNPALAVGGYALGKYMGKAAGSIAASYGAYVALTWFSNHCTRGNKILSYNDIKVEVGSRCFNPLRNTAREQALQDILTDSISFGDLHNAVLAKLFNNGDKYILENKTLNYELLLADCAKYVEEYDPTNYNSKDLQYCKEDLIELTKSIQKSAVEFESKKMDTIEKFYKCCYRSLPAQFKIPEIDIERQAKFDVIIGNTYEILDKRDIIQCEQDVNKVIIDSNLDASMKQELQGTNSLAAKTTIFWKTVKKEYE